MDEDTEYIKLPLDDRCVHKLWKARVHGYEEATKLFQQIADEKSPEWNKYLGLIKKFVGDSNVCAQEKGLAAALAYIENVHVASRTVGDVMSTIVNKCMGSPKKSIKDLAVQIALMYIEIEKHEVVLDELLKGSEHKNPKIAVACIATITQALREFGAKVISLKNLVKKVPTLVEDRDKNVRDETKTLIIEMYKWIGPPFRNQLSNLKPVQLQELNAEFDKLGNVKAVPTRLLRSQQAKKAIDVVDQNGANADEDEDEVECDDQAGVDPYDLLTAVNIISKLPKNFYEKLEEKKWQERKESLDCLEQLLQNVQKLESGDYGDLIRALKKVITKDSNVLLVGIAAKCMASLGSCLKKKFQPYAGNLLLPLLEKFKEKKQNVVLPLRDAVDVIYESLSLEQIQEDVLTAMENKNPSVKAETVTFLSRCFTKCTPIILTKKLLKAFTIALIKTLNESDPTVRDCSAEAIGTAYKVVGEKAIAPFLADVDNIKLTKIKEASEKAVIVAKVPKVSKKKVEPFPAAATAAQSVSNKPKAGSVNPKAVVRKPPATKSAGAMKKSTSMTSLAANAGKTSKSSRPMSEREMTEEEVEEKAFEMFPGNMVTGLSDNDWKVRLSSAEQYLQIIPTLNSSQVSSQFLIRLLCKKPGFKDNNFQAVRVRLECLKIILENFTLTSAGTSACLFDVVSLLIDNKNATLISETLMLFADNLGLDYMCNEMFSFAFQQKNPKVLQESMGWISNAILEFGLDLQPKSIIEHIKKALSSSNSQVRGSAVSLLGTIYLYMGSQLGMLLENEKPAILTIINKEFQKHQGERPPIPKRGKLKSKQSVEEAEYDEQEDMASAQDAALRVDISSKVSQALISELSHRDWKVRMEAIGKLEDIFKEAKYITGSLGDLAHEIAQRLTESNGRLAATAVSLVETIALTMGPQCKIYIREFLPKLWQCVGDNKNYLRAAALKAINTWADTCGCKELFEGEIAASALKTGNPPLRTEMWCWLAERLPDTKGIPREELMSCLPYLLSNLEDRNSDVRKTANDAVLGFMIHIGYGPMTNAAEKLKPSSAAVIKLILDRTRGYLPEIVAPKPASKQKPGSAIKSGGATFTKKTNAIVPPTKTVGGAGKQTKKEESDNSPVLKINNLKMQRSIDESKLKVLKWNFTTPRDEFVEQLKEQMLSAGINKTLVVNMFHIDFKYHLKAIDILTEEFAVESRATTSNLDLILKWMTLRFFDTNPSVQIKGLEYLCNVFKVLAEEEYKMAEFEAAGFLPYLVIKSGDPKDAIRNTVRDIFHQINFIFPVSKIFSYVIDGLKSKNARQRAGCLDQLCVLIEKYGLMVCQPTPPQALKEIAKQISDRDNAVRNSALNCIVSAYFIAGDKVRQMIGQVSDKDMSLLDERIKRASKTRQNIPVATVKPTHIAPPRRIPVVEPLPVADNNDNNYNSTTTDEDEEEDIDEHDEEQIENRPPNSSPARNRTFTSANPSSDAAPLDLFMKEYVSRLPYTELMNRTTNLGNSEFLQLPTCVKFEWVDEKSQSKKGPFELDKNIMVAIESTPIKLPTFTPVEYDLRYFQETVLPITPGLRVQNTSFSTQTITKSRTKPKDLESWINVSSSANLEEAMKALEEIEYAITCDGRKKEFCGLEDQLFSNLCKQLANLFKSEDLELAKCYKMIFSITMKLFNNEMLYKNVNEHWIQKILEHLLYLLLEKRLENLDRSNSNMFEKVVNNLVLRIINRSDHTDLTCALLKMLYDTVANPGTPSHYQELVMKCIWKVIKYFPEWDSQLDYLRIFIELHRFLNDFPSTWWRKQSQDVPLRTYKTIAHTMAKLRGVEILVYINNVPNITEDAELVSYVTKLLRHLKVAEKEKQEDEGNDKTKQQHMSRDLHNQMVSKMSDRNDFDQQSHGKVSAVENHSDEIRDVAKQHMSHELHNQLTIIISKIGDKHETDQGLKMLYEFREQHPEVNIFQFLSKSSKYFQDYVKRGLEKIDSEKGSEETNENALKPDDACGEKFSDKIAQYMKQRERENDNVVKMQIPQKIEYEEIETDAQDFKQRLKLLQKRAGWEPYQKPEDPVSSIEQQTNFMPVITKPSPPRRPISQDFTEERMSIEELKHKLATLKESQY